MRDLADINSTISDFCLLSFNARKIMVLVKQCTYANRIVRSYGAAQVSVFAAELPDIITSVVGRQTEANAE